jgi:hypothetical protein
MCRRRRRGGRHSRRKVGLAWSGEVDKFAVVGIGPERAIGSDGGDPDHAGQGGRIDGLSGGFIADRCDHKHLSRQAAGDGFAEEGAESSLPQLILRTRAPGPRHNRRCGSE